MAKTQKLSASYRVWMELKGRAPGAVVALNTLVNRMPNGVTRKQVYSTCDRMKADGALKTITRGKYMTTETTAKWGENRRWLHNFPATKALNPHKGKSNGKDTPEREYHHEQGQLVLDKDDSPAVSERSEELSQPTEGVGAIENLLSAMAAAEAEIRRLMEVDATVKELSRRYNRRQGGE